MAEAAAHVVLYAGPTADGTLRRRLLHAGNVDLRPPARRGDFDRLVATQPPGVAVLCDGVFGSDPAVSHAELCGALGAGWRLWGVSSMGAIRAYELRDAGMYGHGWVHRQFFEHTDYTDDELCLLHLPVPPWTARTEPLVNLRYALHRQAAALGIGARAQRVLLRALQGLWFGDRTRARMLAVMQEQAGIDAETARSLLLWTRRHRVKALDLASLMHQQPWRQCPWQDRPSQQRRRLAAPRG